MRLKNKKILSLVLVGVLSSAFMVGCKKDEAEISTKPNTENVEQGNTQEEDTNKVEEETTTENEDIEKNITLYISDIDNDDLKTIEVKVDKQFDEFALLSLLKQNDNTINKDTNINKFDLSEKEGETYIKLDLTKDIYPKNVGSSEEVIMLDAITKSFLSAFNADKLEITIDGEVYESGHVSLEEGYIFEQTTNFRLLNR